MKIKYFILIAALAGLNLYRPSYAQTGANPEMHSDLQRKFVELRFGMFIHFNNATDENGDLPDPEAPPSDFNPKKIDADQ
ncbi:hypothetical protein [Mucilaginibacter sp. SG564]|uniref:hypothetical protein n=1 Tax=Mucilaginibacter sp. SG564 TaxID=2587022 RepID=UPI001552F0DD|nr:hypothetical protein [Mucilaginibacter sp. SG564]NOW96036.1 hypothetical protein [Mucilaginibacter sp. SG564]